MPNQHNPSTRRRDRAIPDAAWIRALLQRVPVGVLAAISDGEPYLHPTSFVYDPATHAIFIHSARSGRMPIALAANDRVCFTVYEMGRLLPAAVAMQFGVEYASVIITGRATRVDDEEAARHALQQLISRYFPHLHAGVDYRSPTEDEARRTAVYRIAIDTWSGKQHTAAPDAPGAFWYAPPKGDDR
jgi:hypothetical protein